jgi:Ca2+/H+ antiporter, TMEM165/GDT1 family
MRHRSRRSKFFLIPIFAIGAIFLMGFLVMQLWNHVLVDVTHVSIINFWQALGLFALAKILFSGFHGGRWGRHEWKQKMQQKWMNMSPEEKEKFREEWKSRCIGRRFGQEMPTEKPAE